MAQMPARLLQEWQSQAWRSAEAKCKSLWTDSGTLYGIRSSQRPLHGRGWRFPRAVEAQHEDFIFSALSRRTCLSLGTLSARHLRHMEVNRGTSYKGTAVLRKRSPWGWCSVNRTHITSFPIFLLFNLDSIFDLRMQLYRYGFCIYFQWEDVFNFRIFGCSISVASSDVRGIILSHFVLCCESQKIENEALWYNIFASKSIILCQCGESLVAKVLVPWLRWFVG